MCYTYTSKQTNKRSTHIFCRIFWTSLYINKQNTFRCTKKEYNTKISTTSSTYIDSQHNINTTPTEPQLPNLHHNHPLSLVPRIFRNITLTDFISSRTNYSRNSIHHIVTQQSQNDDNYEKIIEQPRTTNFRSQNSHLFSPR